jgi:hypothetical protein
MAKLSAGILVLICMVLVGCAQTGPTSTAPQAHSLQYPDRTADDTRGDMH